jgi:hypothetical protein
MHSGRQLLIAMLVLGPLGTTVPLSAQGTGPVAVSSLEPLRTPAFSAAAKLHAHALEELAPSTPAGLWIVQDARGQLIASGVANPFPHSISSENYDTVVPAVRGKRAKAFGFARTLGTSTRPAFRVIYVTLACDS